MTAGEFPGAAAAPTPGEEEALAALEGLLASLSAQGEQAAVATRDDFQGLLGELATALTGAAGGEAHEKALGEGRFVLNECTVILRHNPAHDAVDLFCDIGLPDPHGVERAYRVLLEWNLRRFHPGLWFGAHPDSGRLVATLSLPMALAARQVVLLATLEAVTRLVLQLREGRELPLAPPG